MDAKKAQPHEVITTRSELNTLVKTLQKHAVIAVDLEADSMYHFNEKVCLVQLAAGNLNAVVDVLAIQDLSALKPFFNNDAIQKVFHGADYDIRCLWRDFQITVNNLFDTQLACRFLGMPETSLEAVLKRWFAICLNKKYQRKDWSQRPLPQEMIAYAAEDVRYLVPLARKLEIQLRKTGRLGWVAEECGYLSRVRPVVNDTDPLFVHFRGAGSLNSRSLAVLEALLQFRKAAAQKKDRPLFKIIRNHSLLQIAVEKPRSVKKLETLGVLSPNQIRMYARDILAAVEAAARFQPRDLPVYPRKKALRVGPRMGNRVNVLKNWRDEQAAKLNMDPALLLTNAQIRCLAVQNPVNLKDLSKVTEIKAWQKRAFGNDILAVLKNQLHK